MDLFVCVLVFPCLVPLVLVMSVVARFFAPGPIFFRQERVGYQGRTFTMFKFRTMKVNSNPGAHREHIQAAIRAGKPLEKMDGKGDSRLIPMGRLLRATGLDELPQIINIWMGNMSVIGPRPCVSYEAELFTNAQRARFDAVPGITGLWQVSGKNSLTLQQMVDLDIRYAHTLSFINDIKILARTIPTILRLVADACGLTRPHPVVGTNSSSAPAGPTVTPYRAQVLARDARRRMVEFRLPDDIDSGKGRGKTSTNILA